MRACARARRPNAPRPCTFPAHSPCAFAIDIAITFALPSPLPPSPPYLRELRYNPNEAGIAEFTGVLAEQRQVAYQACSNLAARAVLKRALRISPAARCTADSLLAEVCELEGEPWPQASSQLSVSLG